ncbi:acyl carrier protein [Phenylobacterium sp.]|uniref:acyl carrier protein n=1 Tax=Phenylobacterium sp. TaxID=1871053 RepID=UPI0039244C11
MTRDELGTRIRAIISDHYKSSTGFDHEVTDATTLADLNYDSLDLIEVTMAVEDEFETELNDARVADLRTVADVIAYVAGVLGLSGAEAAPKRRARPAEVREADAA